MCTYKYLSNFVLTDKVMDDQAIGGGAGSAMGPSASEKADHSGPIEKRIASSNWAVRNGAFEELEKAYNDAQVGGKSPLFQEYACEFAAFLKKESNPKALEKVLDTLEAFLKKVRQATVVEHANAILGMLVEKCLGHMKPTIKAKAATCMHLLFEVTEDFTECGDALRGLVGHKNVKIAASGCLALAALMKEWGLKRFKYGDYADAVMKNATGTNPAVKSAAYEVYDACYKWMGDAILGQVDGKLKPAQITDLKKRFEKVQAEIDAAGGKKVMRQTRTEQADAIEAAKNAAIDAAMADEPEEEKKASEPDPLEFAPEVDIASKYGGEWQAAVDAAAKWQDKVAKLDELVSDCEKNKCLPGNFESLAAYLKKLIGSSNMNLAMAGTRAAAALASNLKKQFGEAGKQLLGAVLVKYKEKRPMMLQEAEKYTEAAFHVGNLEDFKDEIITALKNVAPGVKMGTLKFVAKLAVVTYIDVLKRCADDLLPAVAKLLDDKDGKVRDDACDTMGTLKGRLPEAVWSPHLKTVVKQKLEKIDAKAAEIKPSKYDREENWKPPAAKKAKKPAAAADDGDDALMTFDAGPPKRAPPKGLGQRPAKKKKEPEIAEESKGGDDGDALMDFDMGPPKRAPPRGIGVRPPKKAKAEDAEMKDEAPKPPPPKTEKKAAAPKKAPTGPVIVEDDSGAGMSAEEAIAKVEELYEASTVSAFAAAKWQDKVEGFNKLQSEIEEKQPDNVALEATAKFIKARMKDFKESNLNLQKAIIATFKKMSEQDTMGKRALAPAMSFFVDKIGDVKHAAAIKEMLLVAADVAGPKFVANQMLKYASKAKAPNVLKETCNELVDFIDGYGASAIPLKETIDFGTVAAAHATPAVRLTAMKLFCAIYAHLGDGVKTFMEGIKDSTMKLIDADLAKTQIYGKGEHTPARELRGMAAAEAEKAAPKKGKGGGGGAAASDNLLGDLMADLPREDISKKLTSKLLEQFKQAKWQARKKGCEDVDAILQEAKMRIEPNGIGDVMDAVKNGMKDPNKAVLKAFIVLSGNMAAAVGPKIKPYTKKCLVPLIDLVKDKQTLVRGEAVTSINKWADAIGAANVVAHVAEMAKDPNPEGRSGGLSWVLANTAAVPEMSADAAASMVKPLLACLTDKSKGVRTQAEEVVSLVMPVTGFAAFADGIRDYPKAIEQTLRPILDRVKSSVGGGGGMEDEEPARQTGTIKGGGKSQPAEEKKTKEAAPPGGSFAKKAMERRQKSPAPEKRESSSSRKSNVISGGGGMRKQPVEEDAVTITVLGGARSKAKREIADSRVKYPVNEVKGDHVERLQGFCNDTFGLKFADQMFAKSQDFPKHIKCVNVIAGFPESQPDELLEVLDLIFKWANLRINDSGNTKLLLAVMDMYGKLIEFLAAREYTLQAFEAEVLIATLADKCGVNNRTIQDSARQHLKACFAIYEKKEAFRLVIATGVKNKNQRAIAECLAVVAEFIRDEGIDGYVKKGDFELFLKTCDMTDKSCREGSLRVFAEIYKIIKEDVWRMFKKEIPLKVKDLLEQRFRQVDKMGGSSGGLNMSNRSNGKGGALGQTAERLQAKGGQKGDLTRSFNRNKPLQFNKPGSAQKSENAEMKSVEPERDDEMPEKENRAVSGEQPQVADPVTKPKAFEMPEDPQAQPNVRDMFYNQGQKDANGDVDMADEAVQPDESAVVVKAGGCMLVPDEQEPVERLPSVTDIMKRADSEQQPQAVVNGLTDVNAGREMNDENLAKALRAAEDKFLPPELQKAMEQIRKNIAQLREGDLLRQVDALVEINDCIGGSKQGEKDVAKAATPAGPDLDLMTQAVIKCCDELVDAYTRVMETVFSYPTNEIPLRFTKYFITIVNKTCSQKEIMREVSYDQVLGLVEQLLTRLLIENLDKIGNPQNKEGEIILRNLNSSMLRMLENCQHTYVFLVLFKLLTKYRDDPAHAKVPSLIIKCLLKLSKNMEKIIEKLELGRFLVAIHEYLAASGKGGEGQQKSNNDELGQRIAKTLINETVKIKGEEIWVPFRKVEAHPEKDQRLKKWIMILLKSGDTARQSFAQQDSASKAAATAQPAQSRTMVQVELGRIVADLKDAAKHDNAIARLEKFERTHAGVDYQAALNKEGAPFAQKVLFDLAAYKKGGSGPSTNFSSSLGASGEQAPNSFASKTASKFTRRASEMVGQPTGLQQPSQNLNNSFNARMKAKFQNSANKDKAMGQFTNRIGNPATSSQLAQTMNARVLSRPSQGGTDLNRSNNAFKDRLQAAKLQKQGSALAGSGHEEKKEESGVIGHRPSTAATGMRPPTAGINQTQRASAIGGGLGKSGGGTAISSNSFRARLDGLRASRPGQPTGTAAAQSTGQPANPQNQMSSLQNRLAAVKAGLNKK